jgi:hypothetical protein
MKRLIDQRLVAALSGACLEECNDGAIQHDRNALLAQYSRSTLGRIGDRPRFHAFQIRQFAGSCDISPACPTRDRFNSGSMFSYFFLPSNSMTTPSLAEAETGLIFESSAGATFQR